jgi:hypothetical protein
VRKIFTTRRRIVIAGASTAVLVAAGGGAAFAYFASTGSGTGNAAVGSAGAWDVSAATVTGGPLYPGTGTETIVFTVQNTGTGPQKYADAAPSLNADGNGDVTVGGNPIAGCKATWFHATIVSPATDEPGLNNEIAAGASTPVTVTITMPADETDDQTVCAGKSPQVTLAVS